MTVAELIAALQQLPPRTQAKKVVIMDHEWGDYPVICGLNETDFAVVLNEAPDE